MQYQYFICDVFTTKRFGGNQLAVLPHAEGLTAEQMQQISREFNFSESTFVFPPKLDNTRMVRIFTPAAEVPFAGHPNIGTAFVLASIDEIEEFDGNADIVFEEKAGLVPISVSTNNNDIRCELKAPENLSIGVNVSTEIIAAALSIDELDIVTSIHPPQVASVGLPFLMVELRDISVLEKVKVNLACFEAISAQGITPFLHVYVRSDDEYDIHARMFAPTDGVPEDPATGSANCALAALLAFYDPRSDGDFEWAIAQGFEMGRPSILQARVQKSAGKVIDAFIGGSCVMVSEGVIYL